MHLDRRLLGGPALPAQRPLRDRWSSPTDAQRWPQLSHRTRLRRCRVEGSSPQVRREHFPVSDPTAAALRRNRRPEAVCLPGLARPLVRDEDLGAWIAGQRVGWDKLMPAQPYLLETLDIEPVAEDVDGRAGTAVTG